jgi:site-specific DNA-methyltransferase (adenine-specific)
MPSDATDIRLKDEVEPPRSFDEVCQSVQRLDAWGAGSVTARVIHGDCLDVMPTLDAESVDAIVCDPPYGLSFMGKAWDHGVPGVPFWSAALRVAKPGAHLVAFGGTRTYHRLTCAIEDAGWEIRDGIGHAYTLAEELRALWSERAGAATFLASLPAGPLAWVYGSGFPKSLDVSKALDKSFGATREIIGPPTRGGIGQGNVLGSITRPPATAPATAPATQWDGWGTALKPAWEPIILARKPFPSTVAANVLEHGTGALNIDACRVSFASSEDKAAAAAAAAQRSGRDQNEGRTAYGRFENGEASLAPYLAQMDKGRWPANLVLDGSAARMLDRDSDGASRFFYTAKASSSERHAGITAAPQQRDDGRDDGRDADLPGGNNPRNRGAQAVANHHPTVKPIDLMRWLCKLVTPPGGLVLDPFNGSGSTGCAAVLEGFRYLGIEREAQYVAISEARIAHHYLRYQPGLDFGEVA